MHTLLLTLQNFSAAEDFFDYLAVPYEAPVLHVHRLHILKRFNQYLARHPLADEVDDADARKVCAQLLTQAYQDFVHSNAAKEKVFKVFQDQDGKQSVSIDNLRASLPSAGR